MENNSNTPGSATRDTFREPALKDLRSQLLGGSAAAREIAILSICLSLTIVAIRNVKLPPNPDFANAAFALERLGSRTGFEAMRLALITRDDLVHLTELDAPAAAPVPPVQPHKRHLRVSKAGQRLRALVREHHPALPRPRLEMKRVETETEFGYSLLAGLSRLVSVPTQVSADIGERIVSIENGAPLDFALLGGEAALMLIIFVLVCGSVVQLRDMFGLSRAGLRDLNDEDSSI
ncbi:MAG TPA: hypothetical protein VEF03_06155 [Candidatus Binataceae bacterium]|nr:hypothetical protein [Candidatus Binataceae bacterium]